MLAHFAAFYTIVHLYFAVSFNELFIYVCTFYYKFYRTTHSDLNVLYNAHQISEM